MQEARFLEIGNDVIEHRLDEALIGIHDLAVAFALEDFDLFQGFFELELIFGFDLLTDKAEGVAVFDRGVVIVFVDVAAKERL